MTEKELNKLNKDTFDKEVPADKREYCWDVGLEILKRYENELILRHPEELTELESFVRIWRMQLVLPQ